MFITEIEQLKAEFSLKEVCDILSNIMCCNEDNILVEVTLEKAIKAALHRVHSEGIVANLVDHIEQIGVHQINETIEEHKKLFGDRYGEIVTPEKPKRIITTKEEFLEFLNSDDYEKWDDVDYDSIPDEIIDEVLL